MKKPKTYTINSYVNGQWCDSSTTKVYDTLAEAKKNFPTYREIAEMMNQERRNGGNLKDTDNWEYYIDMDISDDDDNFLTTDCKAYISLTWEEAKKILGY